MRPIFSKNLPSKRPPPPLGITTKPPETLACRRRRGASCPHMSDPITRLNAALEGRYAIERELGEGGMATVMATPNRSMSGGNSE